MEAAAEKSRSATVLDVQAWTYYIYTRLPAGGTYYPICMFPTNSERLIGISDAFFSLLFFCLLFTGICHLAHVLTVPPTKACLLCATPAGMNCERLISICDAFSAFVYGYPSSCPCAHCTPNKSAPTLCYTRRPGPIQAMPVGTYRVQSPGFPKIVYSEMYTSCERLPLTWGQSHE